MAEVNWAFISVIVAILALIVAIFTWLGWRPSERIWRRIERFIENHRGVVELVAVVLIVFTIMLVAWFLRLATPGQSIGIAVGAAFSIVMIWFRRHYGPQGGTSPDKTWTYPFVAVGIGFAIALFSFIYFGPVIFENDLSDESGEWSVGTSGAGGAKYADGGYLLYASPPWERTQARAADAGNVGDVIVEVDATRIGDVPDEDGTTPWGRREGTSNWGIVCRAQNDNGDGIIKNSYYLGIWEKGHAQFRMWKDGEDQGPPHLAGTGEHRQMISSSRTHHIRAACVGNTLTLWVDDTKVLEKVLEDEEAEFESGTVGLFVYQHADEEGSDTTEVLFNNFVVRRPVRQ